MKDINGKIIKSIDGLEKGSEVVSINFMDGSSLIQVHEQDCCESVEVEQVDGDASKHIGATVYELIEKVVEQEDIDKEILPAWVDSITATFYTLKTSKGYIDWRWFGESNGYYSEDVSCTLKNKK